MRKQGTIMQDDAEMGDINISPMIDMVFILLIFFIVTTVFVEEPGVQVTREYANTSMKLDKNSLLFAITPTDQIFYGGKEIGTNGIRPIVMRYLQDNPEMPVIIQADKDCSSGTVVKVVDEAKLARAKKISLSTEK